MKDSKFKNLLSGKLTILYIYLVFELKIAFLKACKNDVNGEKKNMK